MLKIQNKKWNIKCSCDDEVLITEIADSLGVSCALATVVVNRGYRSVKDAESFIKKSQEVLYDPFLLNDMEKAVDRIILAIKNKEKITVYGDYDVDGVTSVSILHLYFEKVGALVDYYIPCRKSEGYGVSNSAIDKIHENGTKLIVTVDTGVTAIDEVDYANSLGVDVIVTDHHECTDNLPNAIAVINPKRNDTTYPFPSLAGVGVAFKLLCAVEQKLRNVELNDAVRSVASGYADLTAIGTIADVMPVIDENRILISVGLAKAEKTDKIGLSTLIEHCRNGEGKSNYRNKQKKKLSSGFIGFSLAPRINAAGRISSASIATELFLAKDARVANDCSLQLCEINRERQVMENKIADNAFEIVEASGMENESIIILDNSEWHHGVVGIVSSKVSERYGVPSILISFEGNENPEDEEALGKGSGRSVSGMNLVNSLHACSDLLEKYGGHELAAGLSIKRKNLPEFKKRMAEIAKKCFAGVEPEVIIDIECELEGKEINMDLATQLSFLEPYGVANPTPVFAVRNAIISDVIPVGMNRHLKLSISKDNILFTAMLYSTTPQEFSLCAGDEIDLAFVLDINDFNGISSVQFTVKDIKPSERNAHFEKVNEEIYQGVKNGEADLDADYVVPTREDFAEAYNMLLSASRMGKENYRYSRMLSEILKNNPQTKINYVKLKFIIKVFRELNIVVIDELDSLTFAFHIVFSKNKTSLDKSNILKKLKSMYPKR